jgi:hypothetical protein
MWLFLGTHTNRGLKKDMEPRMTSTKKQDQPSSVYVVEEGVLMPAPKPKRSKYPFGSMLTNQSVEIPGKTYAAIIGVLRKHKQLGKRFSVRKSEAGYRVWRLS